MPQSSHEPFELEGRQRVSDQLEQMREELGDALAWDADVPADYNYLFVPDRLLVDAAVEDRFLQVFTDRASDLPFSGPAVPVEDRTVVGDLRTYALPPDRANPDPRDVIAVMRIVDDELDEGLVTLEHYVHLAANGNGRLCPATEPEETGLTDAWPPAATGTAGAGVEVLVVDTGWVVPGSRPADELRAYDGHGSFAEEVVRCRAPGAQIVHVAFPIPGGGPVPDGENPRTLVAEGDLVHALTDAIGTAGFSETPRVITMQAGCHTRRDRPLKAFERLWVDRLRDDPNTVLVAAAGNDATAAPLYPAASPWVWGVGSLDRNNSVSSYSNYRESADVFILGRNHINQFPNGHYLCREAPQAGDRREFATGWARWSGTSFATPLLAGLIAAHLTDFDGKARDGARDLVRRLRTWRSHPVYGDHRVIELEQFV